MATKKKATGGKKKAPAKKPAAKKQPKPEQPEQEVAAGAAEAASDKGAAKKPAGGKKPAAKKPAAKKPADKPEAAAKPEPKEPAEVEDKPAEAPVAEAPAEEPVAEAPAEEPAAEEPAAEEPAEEEQPEPVEAAADADLDEEDEDEDEDEEAPVVALQPSPGFRPVHVQPIEKVKANGIELAYQDYGSSDEPPVLLIGGLGCQLVHWPDNLVSALVDEGLRVIRFDNRDVGESQRIDNRGIPWPFAMRVLLARLGLRLPATYTLKHMAADTVGLMDELGIHKAHLVGMSMGGMIAQNVAIHYPHRAASLTSIMSTTGEPDLPQADEDVMRALLAPPPESKQEAIEGEVALWALLGGDRFAQDNNQARMVAELAWNRGPDPKGMMRQIQAIIASPPRARDLRQVVAPTLVIHGTLDRLVKPEGGKRTAESIESARLEIIDGMGHALQPEVVDRVAPLIVEHVQSVLL